MSARAHVNEKVDKDILEVGSNDVWMSCEFIECLFVGCGPVRFTNCIFSRCEGHRKIRNATFQDCQESP